MVQEFKPISSCLTGPDGWPICGQTGWIIRSDFNNTASHIAMEFLYRLVMRIFVAKASPFCTENFTIQTKTKYFSKCCVNYFSFYLKYIDLCSCYVERQNLAVHIQWSYNFTIRVFIILFYVLLVFWNTFSFCLKDTYLI